MAGFQHIRGGRTDNIMMRIAEIIYAIPYILMVIFMMVVLKPGILPIIIAMSITGWIPMARLVSGQVLQLKRMNMSMRQHLWGQYELDFKKTHDSEYDGTDSCQLDVDCSDCDFCRSYTQLFGSWSSSASSELGNVDK